MASILASRKEKEEMNSEEPPKLIDGEKAYEIWQSTLSAYEGEFSEGERFAYEFKGKGKHGRFYVTFQCFGAYVSVAADLSESGFGSPCKTFDEVRKATEEATKFCGMKPKQYEQLRLF
jgi:hypothetical protein